jgi:hypothetical protein
MPIRTKRKRGPTPRAADASDVPDSGGETGGSGEGFLAWFMSFFGTNQIAAQPPTEYTPISPAPLHPLLSHAPLPHPPQPHHGHTPTPTDIGTPIDHGGGHTHHSCGGASHHSCASHH